MAFSEKLAAKVSDALKGVKSVKQKMMFSGVAFLVNDKMCVNVTSKGLMCRVDPAIHDTLLDKPGCATVVMKGRELKGWILVSEEVLRTKKDLDQWISFALEFNARAKSSKKKKTAG
jgi:TfoX/Sxy family transcriptional regulator of competence genes